MSIADSITEVTVNDSPDFRTGRWTVEEETFSDKMIQLFLRGQLILEPGEGRSLRTYLAKKLHCHPMRISKKYTGLNGLGYKYTCGDCDPSVLEKNQLILRKYEKDFWIKDEVVRNRRQVRRKYYEKYKSTHNENDMMLDENHTSSPKKRIICDAFDEVEEPPNRKLSTFMSSNVITKGIDHDTISSGLNSDEMGIETEYHSMNSSYSVILEAAYILACKFDTSKLTTLCSTQYNENEN